MAVERKCEWCGKNLTTCSSRIAAGRGKFCSVKCRGLSQRKQQHGCEWCSKPVKKKSARFCGWECYQKWRNREKIYKDESWLGEQYWDNGLNVVEIAELTDCCHQTIQRWMKEYDIPFRKNIPKIYDSEEWLREQYWDKGLTLTEIGDLVGCDYSVIGRRMKKYNIPMRTNSETTKIQFSDPQNLENMKTAVRAAWARGAFDGIWNKEWRKQASERMKKAWAEGIYDSEETRQNMSRAAYQRWESGAYDDSFTSEEFRKKKSREAKERWQQGNYDGIFQSPTSIELEVMEVLDIVGLEHISQYRPASFSRVFDEFVPPDIFIEINGDYWHGNPEIYADDDLDEKQRERRKSDAEKAQWIKGNGYHLITFWENDIKELGAWPLIKNRVLPLYDMESLLNINIANGAW